MFTWLNKQGVRSDEGFEVQILDRFTVQYREGLNAITVPMEIGMHDGRSPCISIAPGSFKQWDGTPHFSSIEKERQEEILENFRKAIEFQGLVLVVEEPEAKER